jgi:DNA-directed RNA polymerase subunit M/transcription elongation factor TFIIS
MKIEFNGTQNVLKKIIALYENGQDMEIFCPECSNKLNILEEQTDRLLSFHSLECRSCNKVWMLEPQIKSKRELVWKKFEKLERDKLKNK